MARKKIIIGIHGLGNKPPEDLLEKWWRLATEEGLEFIDRSQKGIPFKIVYWADILHPEPLDPDITYTEDALYLDEPYINARDLSVPVENEFEIKLLGYIEGQIDKIFLNDDLTINFKNVTDSFIRRYFQDLAAYYGDTHTSVLDPDISVKEEIQKRLIKILNRYKKYDILLVAHSMGSIVAFDVLWKYSKKYNIDTFITIGSPLGLPVIVAKVFEEQKMVKTRIKKPHAPDSVFGNWFNFSDLADKVALDHTLAKDYGANSLGVKPEDFSVVNNYQVNEIRNPHKSYGYLRTPQFAMVVDDFLKRRRRFRAYKYLTKKLKYGMDVIKKYMKVFEDEQK
jgi:hypothetical protein